MPASAHGARPTEYGDHMAGDGAYVIGRIVVQCGQSSLQIALAVVEALVKDHHGLVTDVDLDPAGNGTFTVRVPSPSAARA